MNATTSSETIKETVRAGYAAIATGQQQSSCCGTSGGCCSSTRSNQADPARLAESGLDNVEFRLGEIENLRKSQITSSACLSKRGK
ncbi:MAG: hypothetical protein LBB65_03720 [Burkholderiales bacterium]|nr:hypothetical protein [Burkholderiales bacterium]